MKPQNVHDRSGPWQLRHLGFFTMPEAKLWYNKTETKNVKVAKTVEFIKTCDQYPCTLNFGNFFNFIILCTFCWGKNRSSEKAAGEDWVTSFCLGDNDKNQGRVLLGGMSKNEQI